MVKRLQLIHLSPQDAFSIYHQLNDSPDDSHASLLQGPALPALGHAISGSIGAAISNILVYPLDLVVTRLQVQRHIRKDTPLSDHEEYKGIQDALFKIWAREGGVAGLYAGVAQDSVKSMIDSFLFFLLYDYLRQRKLRAHPARTRTKTLPVLEQLNVGFVAGACAKLVTTPISNIVTRKQTSAMLASGSGSRADAPSVKAIARSIYKEKGLSGFWSGYAASLVLTLNPSLTFFLYELFKRVLLPRSRRSNPGAFTTFLLAAMSKAIASTTTYPFSLAKSRVQLSSSTRVRSAAASTNDKPANSSTARPTSSGPPAPSSSSTTLFSTLLHITRTEGPSALYEGLAGEVLKGFLSHGVTMLIKERVHSLIIQAYYMLVVRALKRRHPFPQQQLSRQAQAKASSVAGDVVQRSKDAATALQGQTERLASETERKALDASQYAREYTQRRAGDVYEAGKSGLRAAEDAAANRARLAKDGAAAIVSGVKSGADGALDQAAEFVGRRTEEAGRAMRPGLRRPGEDR